MIGKLIDVKQKKNRHMIGQLFYIEKKTERKWNGELERIYLAKDSNNTEWVFLTDHIELIHDDNILLFKRS